MAPAAFSRRPEYADLLKSKKEKGSASGDIRRCEELGAGVKEDRVEIVGVKFRFKRLRYSHSCQGFIVAFPKVLNSLESGAVLISIDFKFSIEIFPSDLV